MKDFNFINLFPNEKNTLFRPILFSTWMVQAILHGRKTITRRTSGLEEINKNPDKWRVGYIGNFYTNNRGENENAKWVMFVNKKNLEERITVKCPYGIAALETHPEIHSDILWVRETFNRVRVEPLGDPIPASEWPLEYVYQADEPDLGGQEDEEGNIFRWKPCIHMPKEACRLFLRNKNITIERLHDITIEQAKAEGILPLLQSKTQLIQNGQQYIDYYAKVKNFFSDGLSAKRSFQSLWQAINGPESWKKNPYVWVVEFEVVNSEIIKS